MTLEKRLHVAWLCQQIRQEGDTTTYVRLIVELAEVIKGSPLSLLGANQLNWNPGPVTLQ
jgi:hypothetical protein